MSSALPEPEPEITSGRRAVRPGESTIPPSTPSAAAARAPHGPGFLIGWTAFRITVWVLIAVWIHPRFLDWVGGEGVARWLVDHRWAWWLGVPPLGLLGLISAFEVRDERRQRAAGEALASATGGTVVKLTGIDPTLGIATGPGLRVPLGRWSMVVGTWKRRSTSHTVATVRVEPRTGLSFAAHGSDREPMPLRGLQQLAMGAAMRQMANRAKDARAAAAVAAVAYLAESPIVTGDPALDRAIVLRANHPDAARALFTSKSVAGAIAALDAKARRWEWTLYPAEGAGVAEMRLEFRGGLSDTDTLNAMRSLLSAALEELAGAGVIAA